MDTKFLENHKTRKVYHTNDKDGSNDEKPNNVNKREKTFYKIVIQMDGIAKNKIHVKITAEFKNMIASKNNYLETQYF